MLNDIVERLRENRPEMPTRDRYEAADEIERLRAVLKPFAESDFETWMAVEDCTVPYEAFLAAKNALKQ